MTVGGLLPRYYRTTRTLPELARSQNLPQFSRSMSTPNALPSWLVETIAGFTAGVVSTLAVHPLDVVKTRLQGDICPPTIVKILPARR